MTQRRIILFGGTFDPIHIGHTSVALFALEQIKAEKVIFIPAKRSPLKNLLPMAGDTDRFAMIALAIADNDKFELSDCELKKNSLSFTIDTVREFKKALGCDVELYWLIGADCVNELPYWHKITELIDECNLCVMYRAGYDKPYFAGFNAEWGAERVQKVHSNIIRTPLINISSTEIRKNIAVGKDVSQIIAPDVAEYIASHNLYR